MIELELDYPPSINHYYKWTGRGMAISAVGRLFRGLVILECKKKMVSPLPGDLKVDIFLYPPDKRRRDIDNPVKPLLDAMEKAGVYENDVQIADLRVRKMEQVKDGMTLVRIETIAWEQLT